MSTSGWVFAAFVVFGVVVAFMALRSRREGESFQDAAERVVNSPEHQERERARLAGLAEGAPGPAVPPEGETADS